MIAGDSQPAEVHALAHLINHSLGNIGKTAEFFPRADAGPADQTGSLGELARDIEAGAVETLIILGGNPAYDAPGDLDFARVLSSDKTKLRIHMGLYDDETARLCHWHIPQAHCLESWGDLRAFDGTVTIQQPLIAPLYKGRTAYGCWRSSWASPIYRVCRSYATTGNAKACRASPKKRGGGARSGLGQGNGFAAEAGHAEDHGGLGTGAGRRRLRRAWRSSSGRIRRSGMADSRTTAGFRNCPNRLPSCRGTARRF